MKFQKQKYKLLKMLSEANLLVTFREQQVVIAGGAVRSIFANERIKDFDVYFKNSKSLLKVKKFLEESDNYELMFNTDNAYSFSGMGIAVQLIKLPEMITEDTQAILDQFDFTVCMGAYDFLLEEFILNDMFLEHLAAKELHYNIEGKYPLASMFRVRKYLEKGYTISGTEMVKLGLCINKLKIETFKELRAQLMGIDTLFLKDLTDRLMNDQFADRKYDFMEFMDLISEFFEDILERVI